MGRDRQLSGQADVQFRYVAADDPKISSRERPVDMPKRFAIHPHKVARKVDYFELLVKGRHSYSRASRL